MTEQIEKLKATLAQLHTELEQIEGAGPEGRELLRGVLTDIQAALEAPSGGPQTTPAEQASIRDRLTAAAQQFEESHPTLSGMVGSLIDALGRMGV